MNKKILVIEDDPPTLRLIRYTLECEGYQVPTATNGLAGIKKAKSEEPDLIILDVMLPGIDGFEICHRLRAESQTAQLPILMLSAKAQEVDKATGLKMGADYYITKPADPSEIVSRVQTLLTQKTATKSKIIAFLGSREGVGTTTTVVNVAIALSQKDKQVIVLDLCPSGGNITEYLGLKPERTITELIEKPIDTIDHRDLEAALTVHQTGVRVLTISQPPVEHKEISSPSVDLLLERLREVAEYILIDLPTQPSDSEKAELTKCDLIITVTDSKPSALSDVKSTATLLDRLGITQERIGTVIIDRDAIFSEVEISKMKPNIELSSGVSLLGIIPYDTQASLKLVPGIPLILYDLNCSMAWAIRGVAQHITDEKISNKNSS